MEPHEKSDEIPETNDEPVKVVVRKSLNDMVLESGKNGMCSEFFGYFFPQLLNFLVPHYLAHLGYAKKLTVRYDLESSSLPSLLLSSSSFVSKMYDQNHCAS